MLPAMSLGWLVDWYAQHCDGDWEHQYGIAIDSLDNPGWSLRVDLVGTELEQRPFDDVQLQRSKSDWLSCRVVDGRFEAACGLVNLRAGIDVFRAWVEASADDV
jgi:hypothetical protein